jgi:hypothetical protein
MSVFKGVGHDGVLTLLMVMKFVAVAQARW